MATKRLVQFPTVNLKNDSITKENGVSTGALSVVDLMMAYNDWCIIPDYNGIPTLCKYTEVGTKTTIEINSSSTLIGEEIFVIDSSDEPLAIRLFGGRPRPPQK